MTPFFQKGPVDRSSSDPHFDLKYRCFGGIPVVQGGLKRPGHRPSPPVCTPGVDPGVTRGYTPFSRVACGFTRTKKWSHGCRVNDFSPVDPSSDPGDPHFAPSKSTCFGGFQSRGVADTCRWDPADTRGAPGCAPRVPTRFFRPFSIVSCGFMR